MQLTQNKFIRSGLVVLSALLIFTLFLSLKWQYQHDSPIMLYIGFLIDHFKYVPYRDIFDMNMPGADLAYSLIGNLFGYSNLGIRFADLLILSGIMGVNWLWMRKINVNSAWCGCVLWGLVYLNSGPSELSLQREYILLLPIGLGLYFSTKFRNKPIFRNFMIGIFFGIAATIKPHAIIALPLLAIYELIDQNHSGEKTVSKLFFFLTKIILPIFVGLVLPILAVILYLGSNNALTAFLDIATKYWPLYLGLDNLHQTLPEISRIPYLFNNYIGLGGHQLWLIPAAIGALIALYRSSFQKAQKNQVILLIGLVFSYSFYPVVAGQFWPYHWIPFLFFIIQLSSLCLINLPGRVTRIRRLYPVIVLLLTALLVIPTSNYADSLLGRDTPPLKSGRVDEIASFLKLNMHPGDKVQPLDWTGGAIHAMLISGARIATPFIYDFPFYHNISNEYIKSLRKVFINELIEIQPRFVIQVISEDKPWVSGVDTTRQFIELQTFLDLHYKIATFGNDYVIYELNTP